MKIVIQRVKTAHVLIEKKTVAKIDSGAVVLVGVTHTDTFEDVHWLVNKFIHLRIFSDSEKKMNLSLIESKGKALIVSQFTLYADCARGRRPSFIQAAHPKQAENLYNQFVEETQKKGVDVQTGVFAAEMEVSLINEGPVTIVLESPLSSKPSLKS